MSINVDWRINQYLLTNVIGKVRLKIHCLSLRKQLAEGKRPDVGKEILIYSPHHFYSAFFFFICIMK